MSELRNELKNEVERILEEPMPEPSEPIRLETESVFDPELERPDSQFLNEMEEFIDNPMKAVAKIMGQALGQMMPIPVVKNESEHKVKIFWLHRSHKIEEIELIEKMIEDLLNEGYCCHMPTVVNDFVIMDFSRRKETEENEQ